MRRVSQQFGRNHTSEVCPLDFNSILSKAGKCVSQQMLRVSRIELKSGVSNRRDSEKYVVL